MGHSDASVKTKAEDDKERGKIVFNTNISHKSRMDITTCLFKTWLKDTQIHRQTFNPEIF